MKKRTWLFVIAGPALALLVLANAPATGNVTEGASVPSTAWAIPGHR